MYAITNYKLSKYNAATGRLIWRINPDPTLVTHYDSLAVSGNLVIVGGDDSCITESEISGSIFAFNASTGALVWSANTQPESGFTGAVVSGSYVVTAGADIGYEVAVFNLTLVKTGTLGPKLRPHSEGPACDASAPDAPTPARLIRGTADAGPENFPPMCDSFALIRKLGGAVMLAGYRNATMDMLTASLTGLVGDGRPVINKTGLSGRFDFTLEWAPDPKGPPPSDPPAPPSDLPGPTSLQALRDQLGLKMESAKGPVQVLLVDRVERPSEN